MSSSTYSPHINHGGQDSLTRIFFRAPIFRSGLEARSNKNSNTNPVSTKCRLQTGYKMQTQNLYYFFVWYVITCHPTSYRASHNRFSVIIFDDYLYHCRIFLALFLITTVLKPSYSLLTLRASWLVWCLYRFYQRNKSRCRCKWDVTIEYLTRAIFDSFARGPYYHLFKRYVFILLTKMRTETKTVPSTWYIFNVQGCTRTYFSILPYIVIGLMHEGPANSCREKRRVAFVSGHLFTFLVVLSLICLMTTQILICGIRLYEGLRFY